MFKKCSILEWSEPQLTVREERLEHKLFTEDGQKTPDLL